MCQVELSNGSIALVDESDLPLVAGSRWHSNKGYAMRIVQKRTEYMHRLIAQVPVGMYTDHINGDKLDNRRCNLRIVSKSQNGMNRPKQVNNTSGYKGVTRCRDRNYSKPWQAQIQCNGKNRYIGRFATPEEASEAYLRVAKEVFGEFRHVSESL